MSQKHSEKRIKHLKHNSSESSSLKKIVSDLEHLTSLENIEAGIVKHFLKTNSVQSIKNTLIIDVISKDKEDKVLNYLQENNLTLTLNDIQKIFERLIPEKDKRLNGAVFTEEYIVNYIVSNTITKLGIACDCSCGVGAFLRGILKKLHQLTNKNYIELIEHYIYGVDILDYCIKRAKILLSLLVLTQGEDKENIHFNLAVADSLNSDWKKLFPDFLGQGKKFDFVVGNPPYVRIQDLDDTSKELLSNRWESIGGGNYNLYFAFFELGMNLLDDNGKLGYITPNNYFTSLSGIGLREYLAKNRKITKILNFNHLKIFKDAQTYTCITFMTKNYDKEHFEYCYLEDEKALPDLDSLTFGHCYYSWLNNKKWRILTDIDYDNIKKIEAIGRPLENVFPIHSGIATLKDTIYFVEDLNEEYCVANNDSKEYLIEKSITRRIVKIADMKSEEDLIKNKRRIIFPYVLEAGKYKIIDEISLKEAYPKCYEYLCANRTELDKRDKGKKTYSTWYAWGRTQAMSFHGPRLYIKTHSDHPNFILDREDNLFCNGYSVFVSQHIYAYKKLLRSKIMGYYVKKTSTEIEGNYQCYQKNFIEKFGVPNFSQEELDYLENETDTTKIDAWLMQKYGLTM